MIAKQDTTAMFKMSWLVLVLAGCLAASRAPAQSPGTEIPTAAPAAAEAIATEAPVRPLLKPQRKARKRAAQQAYRVPAPAIQQQAGETQAALADIKFYFKLDPRLTQGLYMGERWVSAATYSGTVGQDTVEARAQGVDAKGRPVNISPEWSAADPEMVTLSPSQGNQVKITVTRDGESRVRVASQEVSKELVLKAAYRNNSLQLEIAQAGGTGAPNAAQGAANPRGPAQDEPKIKGEKERLSYAVGMSLGSAMRKEPLEPDLDYVIRGLKDAIAAGETLLTEQEMRSALVAMQGELKKKKAAAQAAREKELAEKNRNNEEAFFAENRAKEGIVTRESGMQYKVLKHGDGRKPAANDTVVFHYRGAFLDGTEFDSSYRRKKAATLALRRATKGWKEALQLMPVGSKWQVFIPSRLAYGARGVKSAGIAPNAPLVFEVELLSIKDSLGTRAQLSEK